MPQPLNLQEAIFNLQKYLRAISYVDDSVIAPPIDGIFDSVTEQSVRSFQASHSLLPNGIVDKPTWDAIYEEYKLTLIDDLPFFPAYPPNYAAKRGEESVFVSIIQILLRELSSVYDEFEEIEISGIFDEATENAIKDFQRASTLDPSGMLDRTTYKRLLADLSNHASF